MKANVRGGISARCLCTRDGPLRGTERFRPQEPLSIFVKAICFHPRRGASFGDGYGGSLSSTGQKKTPREFGDRHGVS